MELKITETCPNCGTTNEYIVVMERPGTHREIVLCYPEVGGCDEYFVLEVEVDTTSELLEVVRNNEG